jgi:uncharacterized protein YozE (UPF0346 family)
MITFYTWILQFRKFDNAIGDLSRDISRDSSFPRTVKYEKILTYLKSVNACDNAVITFKKSFTRYQKFILDDYEADRS